MNKIKLKDFLLQDIFKALRIACKYAFGAGAAQKYKKRKPLLLRGDIALRRTTDGKDICVGCKLCSKICPAEALTVKTRKEEKGWSVSVFDADMSKCIYCGFCVEACPVNALIHTRRASPPVDRIEDMHYTKEQLEQKGIGKPVGKGGNG